MEMTLLLVVGTSDVKHVPDRRLKNVFRGVHQVACSTVYSRILLG